MNGSYDSFYRVLGLRPGASPVEIKAAYRRLAKHCHPDRDKSPDAEKQFREIRTAYETLRDWHLAGGAGVGAGPVISYDFQKWAAWTPKDWTTEYDIDLNELVYGFKKPAARIPFSPAKLPVIFMASLKELANLGVVLQVLLAALIISFSYSPEYANTGEHRTSSEDIRKAIEHIETNPDEYRSFLDHPKPSKAFQTKPYRNLVWIVSLTSGLAVVVLRYYVTLRHKGVCLCAFVVLAYAASVALLVRYIYPEETMTRLLLVWFCFAMASSFLMCNLLGALAKPVGFLLRNVFKRR